VTTGRNVVHFFLRSAGTRSILRHLVPVRFQDRVRGWLKAESDVQWCRVVMNREIERYIRSMDCANLDVLEISGSGSQGRFEFRSYRSVEYPEYDVCSGPLEVDRFDLIIAEQVFEHVLRPDQATASVYRMLRPGGVFVVSTPFLLKVHEVPVDLYRWTEHGMRQLLEGTGFKVLATASWVTGNVCLPI
jgi:SAM-dependent methyltransferase